MISSKQTVVLTALSASVGLGLILIEWVFVGIVLLLAAAGMVLADFRWSASTAGSARLAARGSPALLMVAVMLAAAQGFVAATDAALPLLMAQFVPCPAESRVDLLIVRALDLLL